MQQLTANLSIFHYGHTDAQYPSTVRDSVSNSVSDINESRFFNLQNVISSTYRDEAHCAVFSRQRYLARLSWSDAGSKYTIIAFAKNLFDDEGYERVEASMTAWSVRSLQLGLTAPRTCGVEVQFRFGD